MKLIQGVTVQVTVDSRGLKKRGLPRIIEGPAALAALILFSPVIFAGALLVALTSRGPVFFRQNRVGLNGSQFILYKLRTMIDSTGGPLVTGSGDSRVTGPGRLLRRTKLDELPQLWNVVKGDMSLVGPRPEVIRFIDVRNRDWRKVLSTRPGLTDPVTLRLRDEEQILSRLDGDREEQYREVLLPFKLRGYVEYQNSRSWQSDVLILWKTLRAIVSPSKALPPTLDEVMSPARNRLGSGDEDQPLSGT